MIKTVSVHVIKFNPFLYKMNSEREIRNKKTIKGIQNKVF